MFPRVLIIAWFTTVCYSGLTAQPRVKAVYFEKPPVIDGMVDEEIWQTARPVTTFIQREPDTGQPISESTKAYIGYDARYLYVGFRCYDSPDEITAKELARDARLGEDDRIQVSLDTYLDKRNAFFFQVGPRGSIGDAIVSENGAAYNKAWDGIWTGKAKIHTQGWDAELRIPFKTLNFRKGQQEWGLKLVRHIKKNEEASYWPVANPNAYWFQVSDGGILTGLEGITQGIGLDLVPYASGGINHTGNSDTKPYADAGIDAYFQVTSGLRAAMTVNTDFAQTEVDDRQINLTRFSLHYPEKRDFFLDGANYFSFGINGDRFNKYGRRMIPFFSRRIGLDSMGNPIPILYGVKFSGQSGRWNIGSMYMKDQRKDWKNSHFGVARITRNLGGQSSAGIICTYGNALFDKQNYLVGFDVKLGTAKFRGNRNLALIVYGLKSGTKDLEGRDLSFGAEVAYPNDLLSLRAGHMQIQENFTAAVGFVPRPGVKESYLDVLIGPRPNRFGIMQFWSGVSPDFITGLDNKLLTRMIEFIPLKIRFLSGETLGFSIVYQYEYLMKDFIIYSDYLIPMDAYAFRRNSVNITSAKRRDLYADFRYSWGAFYQGSRNDARLEAGVKPVVPVFFSAELQRNSVILGDRGFVAFIYRFNLNLLFSPAITLYSFIQYDSKSDHIGWQSRFRWIIRPGRELFFVWNSITGDPENRFAIQEADARSKLKYTIRF